MNQQTPLRPKVDTVTRAQLRLLLNIAALAVFLLAGWLAMDFRDRARSMPYFLVAVGVFFSAVNLVIDIRAQRHSADGQMSESVGHPGRILRFMAWPFAYVAGIGLIGLPSATGVFILLFMRFEAGFRWLAAFFITIAVLVALLAFSEAFSIRWPPALLI